MSNTITDEELQYVAEQVGKKPWEIAVNKKEDGSYDVSPLANIPEQRNPFSAGARKLAADYPGQAAGVVAATAASTAAATPIAALSAYTGPAAPVVDPLLHGLVFAGTAGLTKVGIDTMLDPAGRFIGSPQQQLRDRLEHPWAYRAANLAGMLGTFQFNPANKEMMSAAMKAATLRRLAQRDLGLTAAEQAALKNTGAAMAMNAGIGVAGRAMHGEGTGLKDVGEDMAFGALFGAPRGPLEPLGKSLGNAAKNVVQTTAAKFAKPAPGGMTEYKWPTKETVNTESADETLAQMEARLLDQQEAHERDHPTPEPKETLTAAAEATADPDSTKKAVLVPKGSPMPEGVDGWPSVSTQQGILFYNPEKITKEQVYEALVGPQIDGRILGLSQSEKPANGTAAVVTDKGPAKGVLTEVVEPTKEAIDAASAAQAKAVPGGEQRVTTPAQEVAERAERLAAEGRHEAEQFELPLAELPPELAGAKPRYGYGTKSFQLQFRSPEDLAIYIASGKGKSAKHDQYMEWLTGQGHTQESIAARGGEIRTELKAKAKGYEGEASRETPGTLRFQEASDEPTITIDPSRVLRRGLGVRQVGPTQTDTGKPAAGYYDPANPGEVAITPNANPDTLTHEGIHAEIRDMLTNPNERVRRFARDLVDTFGEETLAHHGGRVETQNRLVRLLRDNWAYVKHLLKQSTPESAARMIAERFDFHRPYEAPDFARMRSEGTKFQESDEVPNVHGTSSNPQTRTQPFRDFFGNWDRIQELNKAQQESFDPQRQKEIYRLLSRRSAVVNDDGSPMVVYHGTKRGGFNTFDTEHTPEMGPHFGTPAQANEFVTGPHTYNQLNAAEAEVVPGAFNASHVYGPDVKQLNNNANVQYPVFLNIRKPLETPDLFAHSPMKFANWAEANDILQPAQHKAIEWAANEGRLKDGWRMIKEELIMRGYDGIKYVNTAEGDVGEPHNVAWISFHPEQQVKSAIGNRGTYDPHTHDIRYQEGDDKAPARKVVLIPMSLYARLEHRVPGLGQIMAHFNADRSYMEGVPNTFSDQLAQMPHDVVTSAINKRIEAHATGGQPTFTPEETKVNDVISKAMAETSRVANSRGFHIPVTENYFPHIPSTGVLAEYKANPDEAFAKYFPGYDKFNQTYVPLHGGEYSPEASRDAFLEYMKGTVGTDNATGHFAALHRSAREYGLPQEMRDPDPQNAFRRYGHRWANELARKKWIDDNPEALKGLGLGAGNTPMLPHHDSKEVIAARKDLNNALWTPSDWRKTGEAAQGLMQLGRASAMQTITTIKNVVQSLPTMGLGAERASDIGEMVLGHFKAALEYDQQRAKAVAANATRANNNELAMPEFNDFGTALGQNLKRVANVIRHLTFAQQGEAMSRVRDYTVGEQLANVNLALPGDAKAEWFMRKYAAGVEPSMPHEEQVARIARNYMESVQGAKNASDLPVPMLDGSTLARLTAMQRYGVQNFNRVRAYAIEPAMQGNWAPLLAYVAGGVLTAEVIKKMVEAMRGYPAMPTEGELKATGQDNIYQHTLNWMQLAEMGGMFGAAGNIGSTVANTIRGGQQSVISDPGLSYGVSLLRNLGLAIEAVHAGEQPGKVLQEAVQRSVLDQMQLGRLGRDDGEDRRNKKMFEYLTGSREPNLPQVLDTLLGNYSLNGPKIRPSHEQVQQGDPAGLGPIIERAKANHSMAEINSLDNYPGGFSTEKKEEPYRRFLLEGQGADALGNYIKRRERYQLGVQQAGQAYQQGQK